MREQDIRAMVHRVRSNEHRKLERVYTKKTEVANEIFCGCSKVIQYPSRDWNLHNSPKACQCRMRRFV